MLQKSKNSLKACFENVNIHVLHAFLSFTDFFSKISFKNTIRVSNCLDPDQERRSRGATFF